MRKNFFTLNVMAMLLIALASYTSYAQKGRERMIKRLSVERNEPFEIIDIKVNGEPVALNSKFVADDDWLKGLVISVKNKSAKPILYASIYFKFPPRGDVEESMSGRVLQWGDSSLKTDPPKSGETNKSLRPGETVQLALSPEEFAAFKIFLSAMEYKEPIQQITLSIDQTIFADDTMWYRGEQHVRTQGTPSHWTYSRRVKHQSRRRPN